MTSVKKWVTMGTGRDRFHSYFPTKTKAVEHARKLLTSGKRKVVKIGKFDEEKYRQGKGLQQCYDHVYTWTWVAPRRIGELKVS